MTSRVVYSYLAGDGSYEPSQCTKHHVSSHLHFLGGLTGQRWFETSIRCEERIPVAAILVVVRRPSLGAFKAVVNTETKEFLEQASSQKVLRNINTSSLLPWTTKSLNTSQTNLHSPSFIWGEWLVCDLSWDWFVSNSPTRAVFVLRNLMLFESQIPETTSCRGAQVQPAASFPSLLFDFHWVSICLFPLFMI